MDGGAFLIHAGCLTISPSLAMCGEERGTQKPRKPRPSRCPGLKELSLVGLFVES